MTDWRQWLRATGPWWIVPLLVMFGVGIALTLLDLSPARSLTYSVF